MKDDIISLSWLLFGAKCHLKVFLKDSQVFRLDGFSKSDFEGVQNFAKDYYDIAVSTAEVT
jgi:hypothetical protein